jgi:hypothetical protein
LEFPDFFFNKIFFVERQINGNAIPQSLLRSLKDFDEVEKTQNSKSDFLIK